MKAEQNVNLWLNNDESLYNLMRECVRCTRTREKAARRMLELLGGEGAKTPDGTRYSVSAIRKAMVGL